MRLRFQTRKRVLSLFMVLVMMIGLMPQTPLVVEAASNHSGGYIYFQKPDDWNDEYTVQLAIGNDGNTSVFEMEQEGETNWYSCVITDWGGATYCAVFAHEEFWESGEWSSDKIISDSCNYVISYDDYNFNSGDYYYLVPDSSTFSIKYKPVDVIAGPVIVAGDGSGNWLNGESWNVEHSSANCMEKVSDDVWRITYENVAEGTYLFKFASNKGWDYAWGSGSSVANGESTQTFKGGDNTSFAVEKDGSNVTIELELGLNSDVEKPYFKVTVEEPDSTPVERKVTLHFKDTQKWGTVYGYAWYTAPKEEINGGWPGAALEKDSDGYYTMDLTLNSVTKSLSYIFSNGNEEQTVDLKIDAGSENVELYVQPDGRMVDDRYSCAVDDEPIEKLEGYTISLDGNIGINFYMSLSAEAQEDKNAYMQFTLPNGDISKVSVAEATVKDDGCYVFSCEVAAKEMTKKVDAQMVFSDGTVGEVYTYSVWDYADDILEDEKQTDEVKALVTNMLHYGAYAQTYFKYNTTELANKDLNEQQDFSGVNLGSFEKYGKEAGNLVSDFAYVGASLILESETTLRVWFDVEGSVDSYTVTCEDKPLTLEKNGNYYCVDITDISAQKLNDMYTICVSDTSGNEPAQGSLAIAALTYCHNVLKNDTIDEDLLNVIRSIYLYNKAADEYFGED